MLKPEDILQQFYTEAADFIKDPDKLDQLLLQAEDKLRSIPKVGEILAGLPIMLLMVKSWIKKEYEVDPKVLVTMVAVLIYLIKGKDFIPDKIPVLGLTDDVAILGVALKIIEPELNAYRAWRENGQARPEQPAQPEQPEQPEQPLQAPDTPVTE